ncbi:MAG: GNAT family N-acetyltransferase [Lachnospiraceae bacterium]|nr:GNAT family N-acetyltransferase [Lachnospiraceae bacterium]
MNYAAVKPEAALLQAAPPYVGAIIKKEHFESIMIAALKDGKLQGYAVFSHPKRKGKDVWLEYIMTMEECREKGVATGLLEYSRDYLKKKGVANILCRTFVKYQNAEEITGFFCHRDYMPLSLNGRLLVYHYREMADTGFFDLIRKNRKKLPGSLPYDKIEEKAIRTLLSRQGETGFSFVRSALEGSFSRFMMEKDEIEAVLIARKLREEVLYLSVPYLTEKAGRKGLYPVLFSDVVEEAAKDFGGDFLILTALNDDYIYYGMMQSFNPPEKEYLVQEYMQCLLLERGTGK